MIRQGYDQINEIVLRGDNSYRAKESEKQWSKLLPRPLSSWLNLTSNWEFHTQEDWDVTLSPTNTRLPSKDMLDRAEWISVCTAACARYRIDARMVDAALRRPAATARLAYRLLRLAARKYSLDSREVELSLAMFRIGTIPLYRPRQCQLCFRIAFPGMNRCQFHSRAKSIARPGSSQNARTAQRIFKTSASIREDAEKLIERRFKCKFGAGAIFLMPAKDPEEWRLQVEWALVGCPHVVRKLSGSPGYMSTTELLRDLRQSIDPDEWDVSSWPKKIPLAEQWFKLEREAAPGRPPKRPTTKTMASMAIARELLATGMSKKKVAQELGVSLSNLYQMLHRHLEKPPVPDLYPRGTYIFRPVVIES